MITKEVQRLIDASVLCWLATASQDGMPNVSPKEAFMHDGSGRILVANIASPNTVKNITANPRVCVSFIDPFVQKGFKIKGVATVLEKEDAGYAERHEKLESLIGTKYRIRSIIEIDPAHVEPIIAPSYAMFPNTTENTKIAESLAAYKVAHYQERAKSDGARSEDSRSTE